MPKYREETKQLHIAKIRRLMVMHPQITVGELCEVLKFDRVYATKLLVKIHGERTHRYDNITVNRVLAEYNDKLSEMDRILWGIIRDETSTKGEIISAMRQLKDNNHSILEKMFDAGVFERKLGTITNENILSLEHQELVNKALSYVLKRPTGTNLPTNPNGQNLSLKAGG